MPTFAQLFDDFRQDLRFGARGLARNPGFTAVALATLAVGIGATTAVLAIANAVLFRPPPVAEPDRLVSIWEMRRGYASQGMEGQLLTYERYDRYAEATTGIFAGLAAHRYANFALRSGDRAIALDGFLTSPNYFQVLGLVPSAGRLYAEDEPVVVLSDRLWRGQFAADPDIIGSTVHIDSHPFVVAGIAPAGFVGTVFGIGGDAWIPWRPYIERTGIGGYVARVVPIGRLADGVDRASAAGRTGEIADLIPVDDPQTTVQGVRLDDLTWRGDIRRGVELFLAMLLCAAALLLAIGCANLAGMVLARTIGRRREIAVRLAVGAGRGRLVRQLVTETLLLFVAGGIGGLLIALWGVRLLSRIQLPIGATAELDLTIDPRVLVLGFALSLITGIAFAVGPALRTSRVDLSTTLKDAGVRRGSAERSRTVFVVSQFALSLLLLVLAGLFARSLRAGLDVDIGFDPTNVVVATVNVAPHAYDEERGRAFQEQLVQRIRALPEVEAVARARLVLLGGMNEGSSVRDATADPDDGGSINARRNVVDAAYFETMRVPLVAGRGFLPTDRQGAPPVAVINQRLANLLWPDESAVGHHVRAGGREYEVTGVARDGRYTLVTEEMPFIFTSLDQDYSPGVALHIRTRDSTGAVRARVEEAVRALDPNVAVEDVRRMERVVTLSLFPQQFAAGLTAIFALAGLVLAAIGVYGVLALHVAQRTREFGIRIALGARAAELVRLVVGRGLVLALMGSVFGFLLALAATGLVRSFLYGVQPLDPLTFVGSAAVIAVAAALACLVPARRATRADPLDALRQE